MAAIKRATMQPYDFKWTHFYEEKADFFNRTAQLIPDLDENEWPICSVVIDAANWSALTTRRLFTREDGLLTVGNISESKNEWYGDFKGIDKQAYTFGTIQLANGAMMKYFVETGKASMVMIYGVQTRIYID